MKGKMPEFDYETTVKLRAILIQQHGRQKTRRAYPEDSTLRRRLDESLLVFRLAKKDELSTEEARSWLRGVRRATGIPVKEVARRLGVTKYEVLRQEKAEMESRIQLATLRRAAEALDCELVYALKPREGTLEDLATAQRAIWQEEKAGSGRRSGLFIPARWSERWAGPRLCGVTCARR